MYRRQSLIVRGVCIFFCAALAASVCRGGDVIYETSFEEGFAGWSYKIEAGAPTLSGVEAHSGSQSLMLNNSWVYKDHILPAGQLVQVSFWAKGSGFNDSLRYFGASTLDWTYYHYYTRSTPHPVWAGVNNQSFGGPLYLDDFKIQTATASEFHAYQQSELAKYGSPIQLNIASHTLNRLPNTVHALQTGQPWTIVMLGDSIVNDTYSSAWDALLPDHYTNANTHVIASVRNSTGMNWYSADTDETTGQPVDRINDWVMTYNPDLVILGGISHQNNAEAYRTVIQKIHAIDPDVEILISTGMAGDVNATDPRSNPAWQFELDPLGTSVDSQLLHIATEEDVGFLDARSSWDAYIESSAQPNSFFHRDGVHMNNHGTDIAGEIMYQYFAQAPEPTSVAMITLGGVALIRRRRRNL